MEPCLIDIADILQRLGLDLGQRNVFFAPREYLAIDPGALFSPDDPVERGLDPIENKWKLPTLQERELILVSPLQTVIEILIERHLVTAEGLGLPRLIPPILNLSQALLRLGRIKRVLRRFGRRSLALRYRIMRPVGAVVFDWSHISSPTLCRSHQRKCAGRR